MNAVVAGCGLEKNLLVLILEFWCIKFLVLNLSKTTKLFVTELEIRIIV